MVIRLGAHDKCEGLPMKDNDFDESRFNDAADRRAFEAWRKGKRREAIVESICAVIGIALIALLVKLWFVAEGFIPCP